MNTRPTVGIRRGSFLVLCIFSLSLCGESIRAADETKPRFDPGSAADVQDVLFFGKTRPILVRLHILVDGKPYSTGWDTFLARLFKHADFDDDGELDSDECKRLIPAALMSQMSQGNLYAFYQAPQARLRCGWPPTISSPTTTASPRPAAG
jgi:hypothetical protein